VPDFASGVNAIAHISHPARILPAENNETNRMRIDAGVSAADRLAAQWQKRKREALEAVSGALREDRLGGADAADLARLVHNIAGTAGTAGMFGEGELGIRAGALQRSLKSDDLVLRSALAEEFLQAA